MKLGAFELGGSDPFIVLDDADLDLASTKAIMGRLLCNAQACNNAKRFIIEDSVYDKFKEMFLEKLKNHVKIGDPLNEGVNLGPVITDVSLKRLIHQA